MFIRVLPVSPFSPRGAPAISRYPPPEGEPCTYGLHHPIYYLRIALVLPLTIEEAQIRGYIVGPPPVPSLRFAALF